MTDGSNTSSRDTGASLDTGLVLGAVFSAWSMLYILAAFLTQPGRPGHVILRILLSLAFALVVSGLFVAFFQRGEKKVAANPRQVEEGAPRPWLTYGGLGVVPALFASGLGLAYAMFGTGVPVWVVLMLLGNSAVVSLTWWTQLVIGKRPPPIIPDDTEAANLMMKALDLESEFLRTIIAALTQVVYLIGVGLLGAGSVLFSQPTDLPRVWLMLIAVGLGVWVLALHVGVTAPFMGRHGAIIKAYRDKALTRQLEAKLRPR